MHFPVRISPVFFFVSVHYIIVLKKTVFGVNMMNTYHGQYLYFLFRMYKFRGPMNGDTLRIVKESSHIIYNKKKSITGTDVFES